MSREQERQELYKTIWGIANDLRGSVDGWDFKAYVLGMLAYRYLSESLAGELNRGERDAGVLTFDYAKQEESLEGKAREDFVEKWGYYIEPGLLFENVMESDVTDLNEKLRRAFDQIEKSGEGMGASKMFEGLFTDVDLNSNKLGANTDERNRRLQKLMRSIGGLKLELEELRSNVVGAQLGEQAISTSLKAGAIGLALIIVFMIFVYYLPGLASGLALLIYTELVLVILNAFNVTLTLPGIAGIILGIGMAVDANVIIFARVREEMSRGKTVKNSLKTGFQKAMSAIVDGNVTTLIAAAVLWFRGGQGLRTDFGNRYYRVNVYRACGYENHRIFLLCGGTSQGEPVLPSEKGEGAHWICGEEEGILCNFSAADCGKPCRDGREFLTGEGCVCVQP